VPAGVYLGRDETIPMKNLTHLILCWATLTATSVYGQEAGAKPESHAHLTPQIEAVPAVAPHLTKFDLDFPGGTPAELVAAIQKAIGKPLNVVVPVEWAAWKLPPLKMSRVDVQQLFQAMESAGSLITTSVPGSDNQFTRVQTRSGFSSIQRDHPTDDTVWFFYADDGGLSTPPKVSRFYLLTPYLDAGLTVDDITTAIQTGWRLRGDSTPPALSFHKETKLLIAVGNSQGLDVIDSVLKALQTATPKPAADKPAADGKTKP
jgi:hypothetical protein